MANDLNTFPLILTLRDDGNTGSAMLAFERSILEGTTRATAGFAALNREAQSFREEAARKIADPLGIAASMRAISTSPVQKVFDLMTASSSKATAEQERVRATAIRGLDQQFSAAMSRIRQQQAAQTAAFAQAEQEGLSLIALDRQRALEAAKLIAAPRQVSFGLDASAASATAATARVHASNLEAIAVAAERARDRVAAATLADRAYAEGAREAAAAAALNAKQLTELAATQNRVAAERTRPNIDTRSGVKRLQDGDASIDRAALAGVRLDQVLARVNKNAGAFAGSIDRAAAGIGGLDRLRTAAEYSKTAAERLIAGAASVDRAALSATTLDQVLGRVANRSAGLAANAERARLEQERQATVARLASEQEAQRIAQAVQYVSPARTDVGYTFDPKGKQAAAEAARDHARHLDAVATAAERSREAAERATVADNNLATASRAAADAAKLNADRLEGVAAAERRTAELLDQTTGAMRRQEAEAGKLSTLRKQTLVYTASDVVSSLGSGINPFQILLQQGPQVAQVFALEQAGLRGILSLLSPTTVAVGGLAAATLIGAKAWSDYESALTQARGLAQGIGAAAGLTAQQLLSAAQTGAQAAGITADAAREQEAAYLSSGRIGEQVMTRLIGVSRDYAAAVGTDLKGAAQDLATAFADPAAGADVLNNKLGILDQAGLAYIQTLTEQNRTTEAQTALLNALVPALDGAADRTNVLAQGFLNIRNAASEAYEAIGRAVSRAVGSGTIMDRITDLQRQRDRGPTVGQMLTGTSTDEYRADYQKQIDALRYQLRQEQAVAARALANRKAASSQALVDQYTGGDALAKLKRQQAQIGQTLKDPLQGMPPEQRAEMVGYYNALTRAVQTYVPEQQKAVRLAQLDAQIAATSSPARKEALAAERARLNLAGRVITAADAEALATANGARASVGAARAADAHAAALKRKAEAFAQTQGQDLDRATRIGERFDAQPKLVDQSKAAVRDLDELIQKYGSLTDATSKAIVAKAKLARVTAEAAPETAIRLATDELADQLAITGLIGQGRQTEAAALQDKLQLLKRIGVELGKEKPTEAAAIADYDARRRQADRARFDAQFASDGVSSDREAAALRAEIAGHQDIADLLRQQARYEADGSGSAQINSPALGSASIRNLPSRARRSASCWRSTHRLAPPGGCRTPSRRSWKTRLRRAA